MTIRYRHFHNLNGGLAATIAVTQSTHSDQLVIGLAVANPNDDGMRVPTGEIVRFTNKNGDTITREKTKVTRLSKTEGRERAFDNLNDQPVLMHKDVFHELIWQRNLYRVLCFVTGKTLKVSLRNVT